MYLAAFWKTLPHRPHCHRRFAGRLPPALTSSSSSRPAIRSSSPLSRLVERAATLIRARACNPRSFRTARASRMVSSCADNHKDSSSSWVKNHMGTILFPECTQWEQTRRINAMYLTHSGGESSPHKSPHSVPSVPSPLHRFLRSYDLVVPRRTKCSMLYFLAR